MPEENEPTGTTTPTTQPQHTAPAPPAAPPAPAPPPPTGAPLQLTSDQLSERLDRGFNSRFRQEFGADPDAVQANLQELQRLKREDDERQKAEMTEIERLRTEKEQAEAQAAQAQEQRDAAQFEQTIAAKCAELGIRNVGYAMWEVTQETERLKDGETMDLDEFFTKQLQEQPNQAAYGYQPPPAPPQQVQTGATTTPNVPPGQQPPPPPPPGPPPTNSDAFALNDEGWAARKAALGLS